MSEQQAKWTADPLIWGNGPRIFEAFLEPTCPYSAKAFSKLDELLSRAGPDKLKVRIWLHSQPWHLFSGIICRAIVAASTGPAGKEDAKRVIAAIYAEREAFDFEDQRAGPNLSTSPNDLIMRIEEVSGVAIAGAFQMSGLERVIINHTRYARQNGIHVSPTFMVDGLVDRFISSGQSAEDWKEKIFGQR
jgi:hypothetical protein